MNRTEAVSAITRRPIANLRWRIGVLLFASTVINYLDRQTLSTLAPFLKEDYKWSNTDYAYLVIAFRIAYSVGQTVWPYDGRHRHAARLDAVGHVVFYCFNPDVAGERLVQLRRVSIPARSG
ncbi:MAG: hypothetical protein ACREAB_11045 [Blastocatellia bacterium]